MLEYLLELDKQLFLYLHELGHPFLDSFMWWMSHRFIWIPMYLYLIYRLYQQEGKQMVWPLVALILTIVFTDQVTSGVMKPFFERIRPCHDSELMHLVILVGDCGGKFSFASGHAANTFGLAGFFFFYEKGSGLSWLLILWAAVVSYSRIYLGVHFPGDVMAGCLLGLGGSYAATYLLNRLHNYYN